ncbi:hypothetical protein B0H16DRAFT_1712083 [Mycena metata]|uniref:TauD/TfdA-like domain-containing protein n=1 Tax=Mycena metata TaxID=1033252 RepID=A0AAD7K2K4_9AGAR|nr:hypothetical protein B0H16DRAFT_1712083 [Mycena metata]
MSQTMTTTEAPTITVLNGDANKATGKVAKEPYHYAHLMQTWSTQKYPPLEPFEHIDPGMRALGHANPRSFLDNAQVIQMTPKFGSDVRQGCNLAELSSDQKDQLALEVARRGAMVFRDQQDFIDRGPRFYTQWGRQFGPLHIHPLAGHPEGYPDIHLVYKDANSRFNTQDSITTTVWHSDLSFELQPPGLTAFWLLSQPETGGDTLYASQVLNLQSLSPIMVNFLRTLKARHTAVNSMRSKGAGVVRREPIETVHPVVRRHPVTGEEALYVNKQMTRSIVGMKKEESDLILNFLYDHVAMSTDHQTHIKWEPGSVVVWDNRVTSHTATSDYAHLKARRHGARIASQAERPIPALDGLKMDG